VAKEVLLVAGGGNAGVLLQPLLQLKGARFHRPDAHQARQAERFLAPWAREKTLSSVDKP
jgi:hypothetical protein